MSKVVKGRWHSNAVGGRRKDRQSCDYHAYVPDLLMGRDFQFDAVVAAEVADAEAAILLLNTQTTTLTSTETLARILLRAESVASSRIEGLEIGARRLLHAEITPDSSDVTAHEVLANINAMKHATDDLAPGDQITLERLLEVHQRLLEGGRLESHGGVLRTDQNWIGGSSYNPCSAAFVPPPPDQVATLMADLVEFANIDALPAVAQAAIAHAQFETIHPFVDGNGRTGRALIHMILRRRAIATRVLPPVSLILATWANDYINALTATRYIGAATSKQAHTGCNLWVSQFAIACQRAVADAQAFDAATKVIQEQWRAALPRLRANSSTALLIQALAGAPVISITSATALLGRSFPAATKAVNELEAVGALKQVTIGRRNRGYEAPAIIAAFTDLERQLASPRADTASSLPSRKVPARPAKK